MQEMSAQRVGWLHRRDKCSCQLRIKMMPKTCQNPSNIKESCIRNRRISCQNRSKGNQNGAWECVGEILETDPLQDPENVAPSYAFSRPFGATWSIRGAILIPGGCQRRSKNQEFSYKISKSEEKVMPGRLRENTHDFHIFFDAKMKGFGR